MVRGSWLGGVMSASDTEEEEGGGGKEEVGPGGRGRRPLLFLRFLPVASG